jgi:drug/metabolite transporter (DMT)-like permease
LVLDYVGYALAAAAGWGISDFAAALGSARIGYFRTAILSQALGGLLAFLLTVQSLSLVVQFPQASLLSVGLGLVGVVAILAAYKSFEVGKLSVVSPLSSSYPALSTVLSIVFLGEVVSPLRAVGILFALGGIVIVTMQTRDVKPALPDQRARRMGQGIKYALIAFAAYGVIFFALKLAVESLGALVPVLIMRIVLVLALGLVILLRKPPSRPFARAGGLSILIPVVAAFDIFASVSYNLGVLGGEVSVVSTISALYSVVTVVLAGVFLRERLTARQGIGVVALLVGVGLLSFVG